MIKYSLSSIQKKLHVINDINIAYLKRHIVAFPQTNVPYSTELTNWPSNSPDIKPVSYSIVDALQQLVYHKITCSDRRIVTEFYCTLYSHLLTYSDHLKKVLNSCWDIPVISHKLINGAIDQWSKQLLFFSFSRWVH